MQMMRFLVDGFGWDTAKRCVARGAAGHGCSCVSPALWGPFDSIPTERSWGWAALQVARKGSGFPLALPRAEGGAGQGPGPLGSFLLVARGSCHGPFWGARQLQPCSWDASAFWGREPSGEGTLQAGSVPFPWSVWSHLPGPERGHEVCVPRLAVPCRKALPNSIKPHPQSRTKPQKARCLGEVPEMWQSLWCPDSPIQPRACSLGLGWLPAPGIPSYRALLH